MKESEKAGGQGMVEVRAYEMADVSAMAGVWNEVVRDGNTRFDWFLNSGTSQTKVQKVNQRGLPLSVHWSGWPYVKAFYLVENHMEPEG